MNWRAVPWKEPWIVLGMPMRAIAACTASVARDSDTPSARLNEMVEATNWLWWLIESAALVVSQRAIVDRGTRFLSLLIKFTSFSPSGLCQNCGAASMTTRYWLSSR